MLETPPFNNARVEGKTIEEKIAFWRDERHALIGNGEEIAAQIGGFQRGGSAGGDDTVVAPGRHREAAQVR